MGENRQGREDKKILQALKNLYVHFPFCRRKCSYCALGSRAGSTPQERSEYVRRLAAAVSAMEGGFKTVYFGGGTPALCDLEPVLDAVAPKLSPGAEFTVELHPLDVGKDLLGLLGDGGVNRISMGVQSLDDAVLADMGRAYTFADAERAFFLVKERFDNAGIDLIVGYPGETAALVPRHARLAKWNLRHCSAYSLILEEKTGLWLRYNSRRPRDHRLYPELPDDDTVMNRLGITASFLEDLGLERYEVSNYAVRGFECRHNLSVWRGEDYIGLGLGAHGRTGLSRSVDFMGDGDPGRLDEVSPESDARERAVFSLRTREGLDVANWPVPGGDPDVVRKLDGFVEEGVLERRGTRYSPTRRGYEICDFVIGQIV